MVQYVVIETFKKLPASFYQTKSGKSPVLGWLKRLDPGDRKSIGEAIAIVEFGWPIGMPVCRSLESEDGLWEVRARMSRGRIARLIFGVIRGHMIIVHGFVKKTRKTPDKDMKLARKRMREVRSNE